jgi:transposase
MDTVDERLAVKAVGKKIRRRSIKERRDIVEETLQAGASVSRVARRHDVNANQVFYWRKLYREGRLGGSRVSPLLPVEIAKERSVKEDPVARAGTMEILLAKGTLRVVGAVDVIALRAVLECLAG